MLLSSGVSKILVCAPSNAAVDEILQRVSSKGLFGVTSHQDDLKKLLLRIGAIEYEVPLSVKQHTLDVRLNDVLTDARQYDLRE